MARGWESKDVISRQESRQDRPAAPERPLTDAERRRSQIELDRTRILRELQAVCHPRFRGQLEAELAYLDAELRKLEA
jgi:hypothetical protein